MRLKYANTLGVCLVFTPGANEKVPAPGSQVGIKIFHQLGEATRLYLRMVYMPIFLIHQRFLKILVKTGLEF